ncbi:MAG TPA: DNA-directed RNA polymerase subunit beta' [Candidatus Onthoplasma faecigallinarum]|nr:DNA-directed RNA polymerase subunit beta' [Candidatus Onthoplasma faecigallinarum]
MFELNNFDSIRVGIASPEMIRSWSHGEVTKPETINYRTQKPEKDGLFCERIFGPKKDWECHCGKYKRVRYKGVICDKCGVEVTRSKVRRERMGHIELACPVSHIWFFKGIPSRIGLVLDIPVKQLDEVLYYVSYVVLDPKNTEFTYKQVIRDREYRDAVEKYGPNGLRVGMGAEAIKELLNDVDLEKERDELTKIMHNSKGQKKLKATKKLEIIEDFIKSGNKPSWMILDVIPVIPPDLRPLVQIDGGKFAASDLNDLYRRVINRNNRLKKLMELGAPEIIVRNEKRMLQEAVDALFDNGKRGRAVQGSRQRDLKSLTASLKGKHGRFRQNLLGKRVDYSGRSVIVIGPELKVYQCGLPKMMALELFRPFIIRRLLELNATTNLKKATRMIEQERPIVYDILAEVVQGHPVLLNRAPTLHKLSVQAFEPILVEGKAIRLPALACGGFNADFDGDQMSMHVPLSVEARTEARMLMLASNNVLKPSDGKPNMVPSQDMILGNYYLTAIREGSKGEGMTFGSEDEARLAYENGDLSLQAKISLRRTAMFEGQPVVGRIETTLGRIIFNSIIPQDLGIVDRSKRENVLKFEIDKEVKKGDYSSLIETCYRKHGTNTTVTMIDDIKNMGFKYSTLASVSFSIYDIPNLKGRDEIIEEADKVARQNDDLFMQGFMNYSDKRSKNMAVWDKASNELVDLTAKSVDKFNSLNIILQSGARGNLGQYRQISGMLGIMDAINNISDVPVKSNYRRGLSALEYYSAARASRKQLMDTALKTADSGYLTRRLVDIAQDTTVTEEDCFANLGEPVKGMEVAEIRHGGTVIESLFNRIVGRYTSAPVVHPKTKKVICGEDQFITDELAQEIVDAGIEKVAIRTLLTCKAKNGVCAKCYGRDMSTNDIVHVGEAVGVIAAQSIGEPGTQLVLRTFHSGGVASSDITTGLPRVEEIFEARNPKGAAVICEVGGKVTVNQIDKRYEVVVKGSTEESYILPFGSVLKVKTGDVVTPGTPLTDGPLNPRDVLVTKGVKAVQEYLLNEVLEVYKSQSVSINAKHLEIIIKQMLRKVKVENPGDTDLLPGALVDIRVAEEANLKTLQEGGVPATIRRELQGITKASLTTESFLSAASFQESSNVLTEAALKGKVDHLVGLKENIIIGKMIPAGTGSVQYKNILPKQVKDENNNLTNHDVDIKFDDIEE